MRYLIPVPIHAVTVTDGIYTTGSYADPTWLTSLSYSKLTDVPTALPSAATTGNLLIADGTSWVSGNLNSTNYQLNGLGVGTVASATTGEIRATNNITAYYSDARLKDVICNIKNPLEAVKSLDGVIYKGNHIAKQYGYTSDEEQVGVLSQQVQKVLPQIVTPAPFDIGQNADGTEYSKSGDNYMTVHYERLVPLLIEAIKELDAKVTELQNKISA